MAVAAKRDVAEPSSPGIQPVAASFEMPVEPQASPALALQAHLASRLAADKPKWSRRRTMVVALGASGLMWLGIVAACAAIF